MNNILKIFLVIVLCAGLLMMVGCAGKGDSNETRPDTTQGTGEQTGNGGEGEVEQDGTKNPEGDPFDTTQSSEGEENDEPPVGIEEDDQKETEDDFVVDFGDLT